MTAPRGLRPRIRADDAAGGEHHARAKLLALPQAEDVSDYVSSLIVGKHEHWHPRVRRRKRYRQGTDRHSRSGCEFCESR